MNILYAITIVAVAVWGGLTIAEKLLKKRQQKKAVNDFDRGTDNNSY